MRLLAVTSLFLWLAPMWVAGAEQPPNCESPRHDLLMECLSERYVSADRRLNVSYQALISRLASDEVDQLRQTQRKWITFRQSACDQVYEEIYPGREAPIEQLACLEQKTLSRAALLAAEVGSLEGIEPILRALRIDANALVDALGASSNPTTRIWLRYIDSHCSEARVSRAYESRALCITNHRLVDY